MPRADLPVAGPILACTSPTAHERIGAGPAACATLPKLDKHGVFLRFGRLARGHRIDPEPFAAKCENALWRSPPLKCGLSAQ